MKKTICLLILLFTVSVMPGMGEEQVNVYLNGEQVVFDVVPFIINDCTMVPVRTLLEKMGAIVSYDSNLIMITKGDKLIVMGIGLDYALVNSQKIYLAAVPILENNRSVVPLRFVCEQLGVHVEWNGENNNVMLTEMK